MSIVFFFAFLAVVGVDGVTECPTDWPQTIALDLNNTVVIQWKVADGNLTMNVVGRTKGYVGVGFTLTGNMTGADIALGWVKDGKPYLLDQYATGNERPYNDKIQSYQLLDGFENDTYTTLCWTRKLDTCDDQDIAITEDSNRLIWAVNDEDPANLTRYGAEYHGEQRGTRTVRLMNKVYRKPTELNLKPFDVLSKNLTIPANKTMHYWCSITQAKKMEKQHLVGYEPLFDKPGKNYLHHLVIYQCPGNGYDTLYEELESSGYAFDCNDPTMGRYRQPCFNAIAVWALGAAGEFFPPNVSFPFGSPKENSYYMLNAHYNIINDDDVGKIDHSGIRFYYTSEPTTYDSGMIVVGQNVTPFEVIPARQKGFSVTGMCHPECSQKVLPEEGVNIFSIFFHMHNAGSKIRLHIFSNETEIITLGDEQFDPYYQQPIMYEKEIKIYPTDYLMAECIYDTSVRDNITVGYFSSTDEMCAVFISYYPLVDLSRCDSNLVDPKFLDLLGIEEYSQDQSEVNVTKPEKFANMRLNDYLHQLKLTEEDAVKMQQMYFELPQRTQCLDLDGGEILTKEDFAYPRKIQSKDDKSTCNDTSS